MKAVRAFIVLSILIIAFACAYRPAQIKGADVVTKSAILMGTIVEIKAPLSGDLTRQAAEQAIAKALNEVRRVENLFSVYDEESEIAKINRLKEGEPLKISSEVSGLIEKAIGFCNVTNGAFDITVKPLVDLWAEAKKTGTVPSKEAVREAVEKTGYRDIIIDNEAGTIAFARDGMALDLGGVAKGYAVDRAVSELRSNGVGNAIVNCGGDMYCLGRRSDADRWKVGIRHPRDKDDIILELNLENRAVDTSGDYEKYFMAGGKRYSHIIDPRTGYPVGGDIVSASVMADDSATSDAFATAMCVLGRDGLNVINTIGGLDAIIVTEQNGRPKIEMSDGIKERYHVTEVR